MKLHQPQSPLFPPSILAHASSVTNDLSCTGKQTGPIEYTSANGVKVLKTNSQH